MPDLPTRPDLEQIRHQAKDLLRAARSGDGESLVRIRAVSPRLTLASAQLAVAREYGFANWPKLKLEVQRREVLDDRDVNGLRALLAEDAALATRSLEHWCDHPNGASPLAYLAMLRYDTSRGVWRDVPGTGDVARALVDAGALIDGEAGDQETPLITAASYGDAEVAQVLIETGADLEARAAEDAGGVPGGTALLHAAVFAMTEVVDVLVAAGAQVHGIEEAAAAGNVAGWLDAETPLDRRVRALVMASVHQRLDVIDQLIVAGTSVDAVDEAFGGHPLREAAAHGRPGSVARLLGHGADPNLQDEQGHTPLDLCRRGRAGSDDHPRFDEVEAILAPLTAPDAPRRRARASQQHAAAAARQLPSLTIEIRATDFPGRSCGPGPEGQMYEDVHVGLACRGGTIELVRGDARRAGWTFDVTVRRDDTGSLDYGGPFIYGTRGARSVGLRWGTLTKHDEFEVFRAAKLRTSDIDSALIEEAVRDRRHLVACLGLTDQHGHPVCATVRPPDVAWSIT
jgi:hypothetical protein